MDVRTTMITYTLSGINPMPWTPGTSVTRKGKGGKGRFNAMIKDPQLEVYQETVREAMDDDDVVLHTEQVRLEFRFWRKLEGASDAEGKKHRARRADATNLQKALEDALQGVLYGNDQQVVDIRSIIMEQEQDTIPGIEIRIGLHGGDWSYS